MPDSEGKGGFVTFWSTLPGVLTGLAALITAVGGLVTLILVSRPSGKDPAPAATAIPPPTMAQPTPQLTLAPPGTARPVALTPAGQPTGGTAAPTLSPAAVFAGATSIQPGISRGVVGPGTTVYHQFNVPPSTLAEGDVNTTQGCVSIAALDAAGSLVYNPGGDCTNYGYFSILTSGTSGGVYYLRVVGGSTIAQGEYTVTFGVSGQDDAGSGADVAGTPESAMWLNAGRSYQGLVGSQDPADYYRFQATAGLKLECRYDEFDDVGITLQQVGSDQRVAAEERVPRNAVVDFASRPAGGYLLRLSNQGQGAQYTLIFADGAGR